MNTPTSLMADAIGNNQVTSEGDIGSFDNTIIRYLNILDNESTTTEVMAEIDTILHLSFIATRELNTINDDLCSLNGSLSVREIKAYNIAVNAAMAPLGKTISLIVLSTEDNSFVDMTVDMEAFGNKIKQAIEIIKTFLAKVMNAIIDFIKKLLDGSKKLRAASAKMLVAVKSLNGKPAEGKYSYKASVMSKGKIATPADLKEIELLIPAPTTITKTMTSILEGLVSNAKDGDDYAQEAFRELSSHLKLSEKITSKAIVTKIFGTSGFTDKDKDDNTFECVKSKELPGGYSYVLMRIGKKSSHMKLFLTVYKFIDSSAKSDNYLSQKTLIGYAESADYLAQKLVAAAGATKLYSSIEASIGKLLTKEAKQLSYDELDSVRSAIGVLRSLTGPGLRTASGIVRDILSVVSAQGKAFRKK